MTLHEGDKKWEPFEKLGPTLVLQMPKNNMNLQLKGRPIIEWQLKGLIVVLHI